CSPATAGTSCLRPRRAPCGCGTWPRAGRCAASRDTPTSSWAWPSARTVFGRRRPALTVGCACGRYGRAGCCTSMRDTPTAFAVLPLRPTVAPCCPPAMTAPFACGRCRNEEVGRDRALNRGAGVLPYRCPLSGARRDWATRRVPPRALSSTWLLPVVSPGPSGAGPGLCVVPLCPWRRGPPPAPPQPPPPLPGPATAAVGLQPPADVSVRLPVPPSTVPPAAGLRPGVARPRP